MKERTLVTGFGPFGRVVRNPSSLLAQRAMRPCRVLEVSFAEVDAFLEELEADSFDRLLMLGVAARAERARVEMLGRNRIGATPDVRGYAPKVDRIDPDGPETLSSTLWHETEISFGQDLEPSQDAGDYLCNYLLYRALRRFPDRRVGFLHVPVEETMPLTRQVEVLAHVLERIER